MKSFPQELIAGYRAFATHRLLTEQSRYRELSERGQSPDTMVIGCCDSRVSPEVIFDAGPGELFVVRNVANLVPPYAPDGEAHGVSAALEFAVQVLRVKNIVVLGHAQCGGIKFFAEASAPLSKGNFIGQWISQIAPAAERLGEHAHDDMEKFKRELEFASVELSLSNLMTFPWVKRRVEAGELELHGAFFGVASGRLLVRDRSTGRNLKSCIALPSNS